MLVRPKLAFLAMSEMVCSPRRIPNGLTNCDDLSRFKCVIDALRNLTAARLRTHNWFVGFLGHCSLSKKAGFLEPALSLSLIWEISTSQQQEHQPNRSDS
jgi:hypothetical protein